MTGAIQEEIVARVAQGDERLTVEALGARYAALGYELDRSMDCRAPSRYLTGPRAGFSYPACTTGIRERDTGLSAFNVDARRDDKFLAMMELRRTAFAVTSGAVLEP